LYIDSLGWGYYQRGEYRKATPIGARGQSDRQRPPTITEQAGRRLQQDRQGARRSPSIPGPLKKAEDGSDPASEDQDLPRPCERNKTSTLFYDCDRRAALMAAARSHWFGVVDARSASGPADTLPLARLAIDGGLGQSENAVASMQSAGEGAITGGGQHFKARAEYHRATPREHARGRDVQRGWCWSWPADGGQIRGLRFRQGYPDAW